MTKHFSKYVLCFGILLVAAALLLRLNVLNKPGNTKMITSSILTKTINISELSTAEFRYRGIADIYADENRTKIKCRACYNAVVKAGIDMSEVRFDVDNKNKTVTASLPDIDIKVTIIDEQSMALLPSDADIELNSMLKYCKEDAENEAKQSSELIEAANGNLKTTIEGLLYPILKAQNYILVWK